MPADLCAALWLALAAGTAARAEPATPPAEPPDMELLEFLGNFETDTGPWPELNELLSTREPAPKDVPKEESKR